MLSIIQQRYGFLTKKSCLLFNKATVLQRRNAVYYLTKVRFYNQEILSTSWVISCWSVLWADETGVTGKTTDLRQVTDVPANMPTCIHVCSGWGHVLISTVLLSHLPQRPRWKEVDQLKIGSGHAATQTFHLRGGWNITEPRRSIVVMSYVSVIQ